jgi:hypothetical protein
MDTIYSLCMLVMRYATYSVWMLLGVDFIVVVSGLWLEVVRGRNRPRLGRMNRATYGSANDSTLVKKQALWVVRRVRKVWRFEDGNSGCGKMCQERYNSRQERYNSRLFAGRP